jgi:hypothetical protein
MTARSSAPDPHSIVDKLTEAQRACLALVCAEGCIDAEDACLEPFIDDKAPTDTINECFELGIIEQIGSTSFDDWRIVPLPLGLAVRSILEGDVG